MCYPVERTTIRARVPLNVNEVLLEVLFLEYLLDVHSLVGDT